MPTLNEINPESFYTGFEAPECGIYDQDNEPDKIEEPICKRCLEIESECQCPYYDQIEEVELSRERAEIAMSQLMPIEIEIRQMKKVII